MSVRHRLTMCQPIAEVVPEQFSNGITIISIYLNPLPNTNAPPIENSIFQVMKEVSLLYCLPDNPFFSPASKNAHAVQDAAYACACEL